LWRSAEEFHEAGVYIRGNEVFCLIDDDGNSVAAFDYYVKNLISAGYAYATIKRYSEVVAVFLDYLVEAGVFGVAVPIERLNAAVEGYLHLRVTADRIRATPDNAADSDLCFSNRSWPPSIYAR